MSPRHSDSSNDIALMQQLAEGDESALENLYDRYSPHIYALCRRILKDDDLAEELLLEIFWEIWDRRERYNPKRSAPRTYLVMLARSRCIDRRRSLQAGPVSTTSSPTVETLPVDRQPGPSTDAVFSEEQQVVNQALGDLDPDQRTAIELSFFEGLSHRQIAERLERPLGTIKTQIRTGLLRLRDRLRSYFSDRDSS